MPAFALCGHPAETQSHIQCLCPAAGPALQEARIRAHHNIAKRLWQGIMAVTKEWVIATEQTVEGLLGLPQPEGQIDEWQWPGTWDELTYVRSANVGPGRLGLGAGQPWKVRAGSWASCGLAAGNTYVHDKYPGVVRPRQMAC